MLAGIGPDHRWRARPSGPSAYAAVAFPFTADVRALYELFDLVLLPSRIEGLSQSLLEAMALGKPVTASAAGGNLDLIVSGADGMLVPPLDAPAWARAIDRLLGDTGLASRLGMAARHTARDVRARPHDPAHPGRLRGHPERPACSSSAPGMRLSYLDFFQRLERVRGPRAGFTIVRNAIKLDFPVEASIRSLLPVCDEVVVNVGRSEDETLALVRSIRDPKIRIVETEWDMTRRNTAPASRRPGDARVPPSLGDLHPGDELHERGAAALAAAIQRYDGDRRASCWCATSISTGLRHHRTHRRWYRREVRAVRLDPSLDIRPYQGAQGFRVGPRKIRARLTTAEMFHYGWARPAQALREKRSWAR